MSFLQMLLGGDFINQNEGEYNLRELEGSLERALSSKNIDPEISRLAIYFAQNPGAIASMADSLKVELVKTSPCSGCGGHVESDEEGVMEPVKAAIFAITGIELPPTPFHVFSGLISPEKRSVVFLINDRDGHLASLPFNEFLRKKILDFVAPQIKASIPEAIVTREASREAVRERLEAAQQVLEIARQGLRLDVADMVRLRKELKEAGIDLPRMNPSLESLLSEGPPSSRMPTEPAPADTDHN